MGYYLRDNMIPESLIPPEKISFMLEQLSKVLQSDGDVIECGVYKGGSAHRLAEVMAGSTKTLYLMDTFTGIPADVRDVDHHRPGDFNDASYEEVHAHFAENPYVAVRRGLFIDTLSNLPDDSKFCFAHVDCDIFTSVDQCCRYLWPRMVEGGIILFDDYCSPSCLGAKLAVDAFFDEIGEKIELIEDPIGVAVYVKVCAAPAGAG